MNSIDSRRVKMEEFKQRLLPYVDCFRNEFGSNVFFMVFLLSMSSAFYNFKASQLNNLTVICSFGTLLATLKFTWLKFCLILKSLTVTETLLSTSVKSLTKLNEANWCHAVYLFLCIFFKKSQPFLL